MLHVQNNTVQHAILGDTVFLTRAEAEAALAALKEGEKQ